MLGELPRRPETPRVADPPAESPATAAPASASTGSPAAAAAAPAEPEERVPVEERRSSALRILRRNRPAPKDLPSVAPPQVGRDSAGEGVRIIGRTDRDPEPEPTPEPVDAIEPEPVDAVVVDGLDAAPEPTEPVGVVDLTEPAPEPEAVAAVEDATDAPTEVVEAVDVVEDVVETASTEEVLEVPEVDPADLPPPLRREELRPRIEDLFARIRADRESAVASAREVLAERPPEDAPAPEAADASEGPGASDAPDAPQTPESSDADEHALQARDAIIDPLVAQLTKRLKRSIQDEQNATLDRLRTARPKAGADDVLGSAETQPAPYRYAALPLLEEAARGAAAAAPFGAVGVGVDDLAQALAEELAGQIRAKVEKVMADAAAEDVDLQTTSERVSAVYREWKTQRVERVATHHLVAAWSRGTFVATPEGTPMRWIVDDDGPCPDCDDNALAGPTARGEAFPTGQLHPPAHPGCRCLLQPSHG